MYYEDTDLSYKLREAGYEVRFVAGAVVDHEHAASSGTSSPMFLRVNARNRIIVAAQHAPWGVRPRAPSPARLRAPCARVDGGRSPAESSRGSSPCLAPYATAPPRVPSAIDRETRPGPVGASRADNAGRSCVGANVLERLADMAQTVLVTGAGG